VKQVRIANRLNEQGESPKVKLCERGANPRQRISVRNEIPDSEEIEPTCAQHIGETFRAWKKSKTRT